MTSRLRAEELDTMGAWLIYEDLGRDYHCEMSLDSGADTVSERERCRSI